MNRFLIVATLVAIMASLAPEVSARSPTVVDAVTWGAGGSPAQASPGDTGKLLSVTIRNADAATYTNVRAVLGSASGITPAPGGGASALSGSFAAGDTFVAKFYVNIDPATPVGPDLTLPLSVTMAYRGGSSSFEDDLNVAIALTGHPVLSIVAYPATLPVGEEKDVTLNVTNMGQGAASGATLTLSAVTGSGLTLVRTENVRSIGNLGPGETRSALVRMRASTSGSPSLGVSMAYADAAGNSAQETRMLSFDTTIVSDAPLTSEVVTHSITKGQNGVVTIRVRNTGTSDVHDVTVVLEPASSSGLALANQTAPATAALLAPGATLDLSTRFLSTSAQTDVATVIATVTWTTSDGTSHSRAYSHGLRLWNADRAAIVVALLEDHLDSGRAGTLSFVVTNHELTTLHSVTASLQSSSAAPVAYTVRDATDSQRLGELPARAEATLVTNVITSNSATGLQRLLLDVSWQDADGTPRTQTYDFGIAILGTVDFQAGTATGSFDASTGAGSVAATVTNLGNAIAHNVYVSLVQTPNYAGTQETYLGDINPNTANPFTLQTTLLNMSLLNATGGAGGFGGGGGFQRVAGGAPDGGPNGTAPVGGFGGGRGQGGNGTGFGGRGGRFGGFGQAGAVVVVRWNDEYGSSHTAVYNLTLRPRAAVASTGAVAAGSGTSSLGGLSKYVPAPAFGLVVLGVAGAAIAMRRRQEL